MVSRLVPAMLVSIVAIVSIVVGGGALGCGPRAVRPTTAPSGDEITMYRDRAVIKQRVELEVPIADHATITVQIAAGVGIEDVVILDRGELTISELRGTSSGTPPAKPVTDESDEVGGDDSEPAEPSAAAGPTELTFVVGAPHAGTFAVHLGYVTDRIKWDAAYTMTTTIARDRVTLRGAVAIHNTTGIVLKARAYVVDSELGPWRGRIAEQLGSKLAGTTSSTTPIATPRLLGKVELGAGETRVELLPGEPPRPMHSVLVFDPIGTKLDHGGSAPIRDANFGVETSIPTRVTESFEITRKTASSEGLPGGPVRLLQRNTDGSLNVLGEARVFDVATRVAEVDTVAIGTADGVTGRRERRELTIDDADKRLVEEFVLTIKNARPRPVEVVLREHLYRGQNWTLAYQTAREPTKEGPQQISLRTTVPASAETKVLYVVVYTWP